MPKGGARAGAGRKPKPPEEVRSKRVRVLLTPEEYSNVKRLLKPPMIVAKWFRQCGLEGLAGATDEEIDELPSRKELVTVLTGRTRTKQVHVLLTPPEFAMVTARLTDRNISVAFWFRNAGLGRI